MTCVWEGGGGAKENDQAYRGREREEIGEHRRPCHPGAVSNSGTRRFSYRAFDLFNRLPLDLQNDQRLSRFNMGVESGGGGDIVLCDVSFAYLSRMCVKWLNVLLCSCISVKC